MTVEVGENTIRRIQDVVAHYYAMTRRKLSNRTRKGGVSKPRQVAIFLATKMTKESFSDIGTHFGNIHRTTVAYNRERVKKLMQEDTIFRLQVGTIEYRVRKEP